MKKPPLSEQECIKIQDIAKKIGRPKITVERALLRFSFPPYLRKQDWFQYRVYCYQQSISRRKQSRKKVRLKNEITRDYVKEKLENKWSPTIISLRLPIARPGESISAESIYDWITEESSPSGISWKMFLVFGFIFAMRIVLLKKEVLKIEMV